MIVQHDITGANIANAIKNNRISWQSSSEKLSSGYRVNRSADDAACLTISEKLRSQIRGLNQAANNIQDGISMTNVADGALSEVSDMLHRQTELLIKASNETNTSEDRMAIQGEINQLSSEMEKIFSSTTFNEHEIFKGKEIILKEYDTSNSQTIDSKIYEDNTGNTGTTVGNPVKSYATKEISLGVDQYGRPSYRFTSSEITSTTTTTRKTDETDISTQINTKSHNTEHMPEYIMIQSGAQAEDAIAVRLFNLSIEDYGIDDIDATRSDSARASLSTVSGFSDRINELRSYYGAMTNRMEHAYSINLNTSENLQSAESKMRDTDMAKEAVNIAKLSIIGQASQAILAQSNQNRERVLQLL